MDSMRDIWEALEMDELVEELKTGVKSITWGDVVYAVVGVGVIFTFYVLLWVLIG